MNLCPVRTPNKHAILRVIARIALLALVLTAMPGCSESGQGPERVIKDYFGALIAMEDTSPFEYSEEAVSPTSLDPEALKSLNELKKDPGFRAQLRFQKKYTKVRFHSLEISGDEATAKVFVYTPDVLEVRFAYEGEQNENAYYRYMERKKRAVKSYSITFAIKLRRQNGQWKMLKGDDRPKEDEAVIKQRISAYEDKISFAIENPRQDRIKKFLSADIIATNNGDETLTDLVVRVVGMDQNAKWAFNERLETTHRIPPGESAKLELLVGERHPEWVGACIYIIERIGY